MLDEIKTSEVNREFESNANRVDYGAQKLVSQRQYNLRGAQTFNQEYDANGNQKSSITTRYNADGKTLVQEMRDKDGVFKNRVSFDHADSYDAAGNLVHYSYEEGGLQAVPIYSDDDWAGGEDGPPQPIGYETRFVPSWAYQYKFTYARFDSYKEASIQVDSNHCLFIFTG